MIDWLGHISRALILSATSAEILAILGATLSVFTVVVQSFYVVSLQKRQKKALAAMARLVLSYSSLENWNKNPGTQDRLKTMYDEVTDILDNVVATFQEIYKAKVSGAIKILFTTTDGEMSVRTLARDKKSKVKREILDITYPVMANTPFTVIMADQAPFFLNNDLQAASEGGYYYDSNAAWSNLYKSVVVVPIKRTGPPQLYEMEPLGFLTVDSPKTGVFDENAVTILQSISNIIASRLVALDEEMRENA